MSLFGYPFTFTLLGLNHFSRRHFLPLCTAWISLDRKCFCTSNQRRPGTGSCCSSSCWNTDCAISGKRPCLGVQSPTATVIVAIMVTVTVIVAVTVTATVIATVMVTATVTPLVIVTATVTVVVTATECLCFNVWWDNLRDNTWQGCFWNCIWCECHRDYIWWECDRDVCCNKGLFWI